MKSIVFLLLFFITSATFAQNNYIVKTEDGRRVLLKADYTWEYIDAVPKEGNKIDINHAVAKSDDACNLGSDYEEPKLNGKIQSQLKKGRATIDDVKAKVAKDYNCAVEEVILLSASEQKSKGRYQFCANGKKVDYKRTGFTIIENGKLF
ncbi:DUF3157 family protein [Aestuariibaculum suncheonense]|uniref:DUF3157 family protein n=1 Tax=Aestuariibaculum suncheonense TaxID=1028745 RepID=A0A8J6Q3W1_9FLAO|nr:DUF3157 family protein [Aestuariibaculum suncheonense]MBD0833959.1 DUF3157 family protein [Aestuariibaculum suncheonense]